MAYTNIDDPSAYFQIALYAGDSSNSTVITNDGNSDLQPDWVWIKSRNEGNAGTGGHMWFDSSRGIKSTTGSDSPFLVSNSTSGDQTNANALQAVSTDSFTPGSMTRTNETGDTYVAWQWKGNGGTTASNTDGDINSTVQVNQDAGFSIVTYTGNGSTSDQTIGHGLGVRANAVIVKNRDAAVNWVVWSEGVDANHSLELNTTDGISDSTQGRVLSNAGSRGTSTIFSIRSGSGSVVQTNTSGEDYIAYCFAEKQGYSKFSSYVGNSNVNGPFIYLGFKPAFVMIKRADAGTSYSSWAMFDNKRLGYNPTGGPQSLYANREYGEGKRGQGSANSSRGSYRYAIKRLQSKRWWL